MMSGVAPVFTTESDSDCEEQVWPQGLNHVESIKIAKGACMAFSGRVNPIKAPFHGRALCYMPGHKENCSGAKCQLISSHDLQFFDKQHENVPVPDGAYWIAYIVTQATRSFVTQPAKHTCWSVAELVERATTVSSLKFHTKTSTAKDPAFWVFNVPSTDKWLTPRVRIKANKKRRRRQPVNSEVLLRNMQQQIGIWQGQASAYLDQQDKDKVIQSQLAIWKRQVSLWQHQQQQNKRRKAGKEF